MSHPRGASRAQAHIFRVRILEGVSTPFDASSIWREIELRGDQTLADLGHAIPGAFGFDDDHLWSFFLSGNAWDAATAYTCDDQEEGRPAERLRIHDARAGGEFLFLFDYGDQWHFGVRRIRTGDVDPGAPYPRVVARNGEAPPALLEYKRGAAGAELTRWTAGDLPSPEELGAAAAAAPGLRRLHELSRWVGEGRNLTPSGRPTCC